jgi:hypothetical protein
MGWGRLAKISEMTINPVLFPDLNGLKPLAAVFIERFRMTFPLPQAVNAGGGA